MKLIYESGRERQLRSAALCHPDSGLSVLRKIRLLLEERNGTFRVTAQLLFTGRDASLYLVPYATRGDYFYGEQTFAPGQRDAQIKFREQVAAERRPKLSIHASGQVHIYADEAPKVGPVRIPPLVRGSEHHPPRAGGRRRQGKAAVAALARPPPRGGVGVDRGGASLSYVARVLGHANPAITLSIYAHVFARAEHEERFPRASGGGLRIYARFRVTASEPEQTTASRLRGGTGCCRPSVRDDGSVRGGAADSTPWASACS
jgi:hypothetical protein